MELWRELSVVTFVKWQGPNRCDIDVMLLRSSLTTYADTIYGEMKNGYEREGLQCAELLVL